MGGGRGRECKNERDARTGAREIAREMARKRAREHLNVGPGGEGGREALHRDVRHLGLVI